MVRAARALAARIQSRGDPHAWRGWRDPKRSRLPPIRGSGEAEAGALTQSLKLDLALRASAELRSPPLLNPPRPGDRRRIGPRHGRSGRPLCILANLTNAYSDFHVHDGGFLTPLRHFPRRDTLDLHRLERFE
jgi:hypothetical protein